MTPEPDIPHEALDVQSQFGGFMPQIGIHRRGRIYYQESSYSHLWFMAMMLVAAVVMSLLPWHTVALGGLKLKYWLAIGFVWGAICVLGGYLIRNACGQTIIINPQDHTLRIIGHRTEQTIAWPQIIALQICFQRAPRGSEFSNSYQLNLVWQDSTGPVKRHCLLNHTVKRFVVSLGNRYAALCHARIIDETENGSRK